MYLTVPTSSFFSSCKMLIRILTINLHLPLYLQAASIDGCAARLSASEVSFFAFCLILPVVHNLFCRFYLLGAISVQHALSSSTRKRENGERYEKAILHSQFKFSISLSGQVGDLHEARSSHGCAPYISPEVCHFLSALRFSTSPNSISCTNIQRMAK